MNLENEILSIMSESTSALTVDQVTREVTNRISDEIRTILNGLVKKEQLNYLPAGGRHQARYMAPPRPSIERRF
jgi:predicted transcriptional regulator